MLQMNRASEFKIFNSPTVNFSTPVTPTVKNDNKQKIKGKYYYHLGDSSD